MFSKCLLVCLLLAVLYTTVSQGSIGGFICPDVKKKFEAIAVKALTAENGDLSGIYHAGNTLKLLKQQVPSQSKQSSCENITKLLLTNKDPANLYYGLAGYKVLGCSGKLPSDDIAKIIQDVLQNSKSTLADLRYAAEGQVLLGKQISDVARIVQNVEAQLSSDDSVASLGQALHLAVLLNRPALVAERIEDIVVQADEIDNKLLQWEGGLSTTSLIITGLLKFPTANPLNQVQAEKLANYLLSRVTVQTPKGTSALLEAATALAASKVSPVSISISGSSSVTLDKPNLQIQVSNLFGEPIKPAPSPVVAQSAARIVDDVVVLAKQPLSAGTKETEFVLPLKLEPGYYKISLNAGPHSATLNARVLGPVEVKNFEIGLSETDGSAAPKLDKVVYPNKLGKLLQGDSGQNLLVKFQLSRQVHQAFLRLSSGKKEIIFVAGQEPNNHYKVEADLGVEFPVSDKFNIELIIGDSIITNPLRWTVGEIAVTVPTSLSYTSARKFHREPKPEIRHKFREPENRPPKVVSLFFTALTAAPLLVLFVLWGKIGVNISNFSTRAGPFHLGFGGILALFTLFWLKLDMFQTCTWFIPLGLFTFTSLHRFLNYKVKSKKPEK